jgi:hypothetical protein
VRGIGDGVPACGNRWLRAVLAASRQSPRVGRRKVARGMGRLTPEQRMAAAARATGWLPSEVRAAVELARAEGAVTVAGFRRAVGSYNPLAVEALLEELAEQGLLIRVG